MDIISLNTIVRVNLTETGGIILMLKTYGIPPKGLKGKVWEAPLWEVMAMFGEHLQYGMLDEEAVIADGGKMEIIKP